MCVCVVVGLRTVTRLPAGVTRSYKSYEILRDWVQGVVPSWQWTYCNLLFKRSFRWTPWRTFMEAALE